VFHGDSPCPSQQRTLLAKIRLLSHDFVTPEDACPTYRAFYDGLKEFEQDLHQHIHLENNILFPRAIAIEESANVESRYAGV
jgi:regulator of cell morphogenesis and NO signaling